MVGKPPPTGTVTFLFTDIEGSTALYENYPAQMQGALKRHDEILRSCIEEFEGYVFKTVGDAFCAAFATARAALEATLASQRALVAEAWPENTTLRVRMALHTGVADERDGDYFGPPVNRVARLLSAGHGGQILLSDATYNLARDHLVHLEASGKLHDLGEHRLKDLRYTERIYQLVVDDLPKDFPPLRTHGVVSQPELSNLDRRYHRIRHIGSGGMGEVYLIHHEALDRDMALKILKNQYADDEQFVERFRREAKSMAKLSHPNIVQVYDAGEGLFEGSHISYMAMEYVSGGTLKELIRQHRGPLPSGVATALALQVAKALEVAHRQGVIHRDIKPQNILITESGEAKVADFGLARAAGSSTTLTRMRLLMGTLHYVSPEQVQGEPASPQSDLYALGVVFYEMLTGELPFEADTPAGLIMKHITGQLQPPQEANPEVPEGINAVNMKLLAKEPNERYRTASEFIAALELVKEDSSDSNVMREMTPSTVELEAGREDRVDEPTTVEVPDLRGEELQKARDMLAEARLALGSKSETPSEEMPEGRIVEQDFVAGMKIEAGSFVGVMVSSGPKKKATTTVRDVSDLSIQEAAQILSNARLTLGDLRVQRSSKPEGTIISTDPSAGSEVAVGTSVTPIVSSSIKSSLSGPGGKSEGDKLSSPPQRTSPPGSSLSHSQAGDGARKRPLKLLLAVGLAVSLLAIAVGWGVWNSLYASTAPEATSESTAPAATPAFLGMNVIDATPEVAQRFGISAKSGALVERVYPDGPATSAGIRLKDVITALGPTEIKDGRDLIAALGEYKPGDTVQLTVVRGDNERKIDVVLGEPESTQPALKTTSSKVSEA